MLKGYRDAEEGYIRKVLPDKIALYRRYIADVGCLTDMKILLATVLKIAAPAPLDRTRPS